MSSIGLKTILEILKKALSLARKILKFLAKWLSKFLYLFRIFTGETKVLNQYEYDDNYLSYSKKCLWGIIGLSILALIGFVFISILSYIFLFVEDNSILYSFLLGLFIILLLANIFFYALKTIFISYNHKHPDFSILLLFNFIGRLIFISCFIVFVCSPIFIKQNQEQLKSFINLKKKDEVNRYFLNVGNSMEDLLSYFSFDIFTIVKHKELLNSLAENSHNNLIYGDINNLEMRSFYSNSSDLWKDYHVQLQEIMLRFDNNKNTRISSFEIYLTKVKLEGFDQSLYEIENRIMNAPYVFAYFDLLLNNKEFKKFAMKYCIIFCFPFLAKLILVYFDQQFYNFALIEENTVKPNIYRKYAS